MHDVAENGEGILDMTEVNEAAGQTLLGRLRGMDVAIEAMKDALADLVVERGRIKDDLIPHLRAAEDQFMPIDGKGYALQEFDQTRVKSYKDLWDLARSKVNPATQAILDKLKEEMSSLIPIVKVVFKKKKG